MTVKQLIKLLKKFNHDLVVLVPSHDADLIFEKITNVDAAMLLEDKETSSYFESEEEDDKTETELLVIS